MLWGKVVKCHRGPATVSGDESRDATAGLVPVGRRGE
jgi:hypothetical protein